MNYIAHIHLGEHTKTSLLGNFLGDFIKGSQLSHLPAELEQGVRLHRCIDVFTDTHELIVDTKKLFPPDLRRLSGVIMDIYFDYLLMQKWSSYSQRAYQKVFDEFYQQLGELSMPDNSHFASLQHRLLTQRWLHAYLQPNTYHQAFFSIEKRLNNKITFADKANLFVQQQSHLLESRFEQFYPQCLAHGEQFIASYSSHP